ncbi:MAG: DoxX family protein [Pseudomonadota bacterium]
MSISAIENRASSGSLETYVPVLGRLLLAAIFLLSGVGKVFAPGPTQAYITAAGLPAPLLAYLIATVVEVAGGALLVLGYQTRIVALVLAVFTLATAFGFHNNFADQGQMIHFMKNLAITGGLLQVVAFGAGGFSLDARR